MTRGLMKFVCHCSCMFVYTHTYVVYIVKCISHPRPLETLTLGQDALDAVSQDDGGSLDVHAVQQVGRLGCRHPMTAGALYEIHHL